VQIADRRDIARLATSVALPDDIDDPDLKRLTDTSPTRPCFLERTRDSMEPGRPRQAPGIRDRPDRSTDDDVRRFIDIDELVRLWTQLWLSPRRPLGTIFGDCEASSWSAEHIQLQIASRVSQAAELDDSSSLEVMGPASTGPGA